MLGFTLVILVATNQQAFVPTFELHDSRLKYLMRSLNLQA